MQNAIELTSPSTIGGNFIVLQTRNENVFWVLRDKHYATEEEAKNALTPGRADDIIEWVLERVFTIHDNSKSAGVKYFTRCGSRIVVAVVEWVRGGEPGDVSEKAPFAGYGAGRGYEGSDYVEEVNVTLL